MLVDHAWNVMAGGKNDAYAKLKSQNLLAKNVLEPYKFQNICQTWSPLQQVANQRTKRSTHPPSFDTNSLKMYYYRSNLVQTQTLMFYVPFSHYKACEALYLFLQFTSQNNIILIKPHLSSYSTDFQHITIKNRLKL